LFFGAAHLVRSWIEKLIAMHNVSIQKASELPPRLKAAVEQLLGRPIDADEEVSIAAVPPQQIAPSQSRASVAEKLDAFLSRRAAKVREVLIKSSMR
jgi:hypothetical protein